MIKLHNILVAAAVATTLTLSACGGGGDDETVPDTAVPASAGSSVRSFMSFIQGLNPNDETSEPLTISDSFAVPDDEVTDA